MLGLPIDRVSARQTVDKINEFVKKRQPTIVVTPNVAHIMIAQRDQDFMRIYQEADLSVVDGVPLLWAAKFLNQPLIERVNGTDLLVNLCELAYKNGYKVFFLGSAPGVADMAAENLKKKYPTLDVVGTHSPPLGFEQKEDENNKVVDLIKEYNPDILFVGLGAPKQEKWAYRYKNVLGVPVVVGIGASFEYLAGQTKRAPKWMQKNGLEWLFRVIRDPWRYGKRYLTDLSFFPLLFMFKFRKGL